jgi:hypothetical protein
MNKQRAKKQHYVPQCLLRRFSHDGGESIHTYDTSTKKYFPTNVANAAHQTYFNEFQSGEEIISIEEWLGSIETMTAPSIDRLLSQDSLAAFDADHRARICHFAAIQFARTAAFRNRTRDAFAQMQQALEKKLSCRGESVLWDQGALRLSDSEAREFGCRQVIEAPQKFAEHFATKAWVLLSTQPTHPFVLGDNPVALHNSRSFVIGGNLGLAVPGIEIYLPLSPERVLCFLCPSHMENPIVHSAAMDGHVLRLAVADVDAVNAIQILNAERFVFSSTADFRLVERVTNGKPAADCGPHFVCN